MKKKSYDDIEADAHEARATSLQRHVQYDAFEGEIRQCIFDNRTSRRLPIFSYSEFIFYVKSSFHGGSTFIWTIWNLHTSVQCNQVQFNKLGDCFKYLNTQL